MQIQSTSCASFLRQENAKLYGCMQWWKYGWKGIPLSDSVQAMNQIQHDTNIVARLDRVERSLTRVRGTNLVLIAALAALVIGGANAPQDTMSVRRLAVVDASGKERLVLNGEDDNKAAGLAWYDEEGIVRLSAKTYPSGQSSFQCLDTKGLSRIALTTQTSGESSVQWRDMNNKLRIGGSTKPNGEALMIWMAANGKQQIKIYTDENGVAKFNSGG
jgi:hypothetical protein